MKSEEFTLNANFHELAKNFLKGVWEFCSL